MKLLETENKPEQKVVRCCDERFFVGIAIEWNILLLAE